VPVTINSDDPPMFSTTLNDEYLVAARLLGLDAGGIADLARAGIAASFMAADRKDDLLRDVDAYEHRSRRSVASLDPADRE
jgi:adenosine deaminase